MNNNVFFLVPIIVGMISGIFLIYSIDDDAESLKITSKALIQNGSPILGNPDAPITILEWGDYQCTYCYKFHQNSLNVIFEDYIQTGKVKLVFKDFPLNGDDSVLGAQATHCANDQNKFWEFHNELYDNWKGERTGWITRESLSEFAKNIELDVEQFDNCIEDLTYLDKVSTNHEFGKEIGIDATPSFLVFNDEKMIKIRGNQPLEVFLKTFGEFQS
jgi:protein-disulfide isomerase